jgi:hypothetical protein
VQTAPSGNPARAAEAHRALLQDGSIQFEMDSAPAPAPAPEQSEPPAWLEWLSDLLANGGPVFKFFLWTVIALIVLAIIYAVARWASGGGFDIFRRRKKIAAEAEESWAIAEAPARALLAEADRLAAAGRFSEAAHLLLYRSIEEIDRRQPEVVRPALTSRDIARAPQLPPGPRSAFARIAMAVERSLFGGLSLIETDWQSCRTAYEEFALAREWSR